MDDKQAAAVLRTHSDIRRKRLEQDPGETVDVIAEAAERGAETLEFKEWLFVPGRFCELWFDYELAHGDTGDFLAYCEAKFEESKRHG